LRTGNNKLPKNTNILLTGVGICDIIILSGRGLRPPEVSLEVSGKKERFPMAKVRVWECEDWFEIWCADREGMIATMVRNLASDLAVGYSYFGECATRQRALIEKTRKEYEDALEMFKTMESAAIVRWCYFDLKKRGAIS